MRTVRFPNSLKSSAGLSEKHEADKQAEIAARQLWPDIAADCLLNSQLITAKGDASIMAICLRGSIVGRLAGKTLWRVEVFTKK
jgi:hypothetical protein